MATVGAQTQGDRQPSTSAPASSGGGSPTALLTSALASADAAFKKEAAGDRRVMAAFSLGWQMA
jgi:hypothetical protein